ncbi:MAG TPA: energy transducer TonB [Verrucomicrobiae bacterium]|nr:energy transducer TonB [Verrucomicrobiae bacterium]
MSATQNQVTGMPDYASKPNDASRSADEPTLQLGRLGSPSRQSSAASLFSNLKDFLTERPKKIPAGTPTAFDTPEFGSGISGNLQEFFRSGPRGSIDSRFLVNWKEEAGFWQNLRDWIAPPKLPPLKTTSQPVAVPEIWTKNKQFGRLQAVSIAVHAILIAAIVLIPLFLPNWISPPVTKAFNPEPVDVSVSPYLAKLAPSTSKAGGGGGAHDTAPAQKGKLPKFANLQFSAPLARPVQHPEIAMTPTVVGNPNLNLPNIQAPVWGDPFGKSGTGSMGQGHGSGIGNGNGAGVGPGQGYGAGGGLPSAGIGGYGEPACYYMPKAEYTDEAIKVKIQGAVELLAVVTADGRVINPHVAKGLGFGLDEKAVQAVQTWRCTPARGPDGKPASVQVLIESTFSLY